MTLALSGNAKSAKFPLHTHPGGKLSIFFSSKETHKEQQNKYFNPPNILKSLIISQQFHSHTQAEEK